MRFKSAGNKADLMAVVVHNADTVTIGVGVPVVLNGNGTNDGLDVVLPSTNATLANIIASRYGVTCESMVVGAYADAIVFGFHPGVTLEINSRASTTASWSTQAAVSAGAYLTIDTVNNLLVTQVATQGFNTNSLTNNALGTFYNTPLGMLLGGVSGTGTLVASQAGSASSTADTRLVLTASVHAFIRMM